MSLCIVCNNEAAKYKCPTCQSPYCSITCYKAHKETHSAEKKNEKEEKKVDTQDASLLSQSHLENQQPQQPQQQASPAKATVNNNHHQESVDFSPLESFSELQRLFTRYPPLRAQLQKIYNIMREPSPDLSDEQHNQGNRGRSSSGRGRGGRGDYQGGGGGGSDRRRKQQWTPERATMEGLFILKKMRQSQVEETEGLEEFKQLVLKLCVESEEKARGGGASSQGNPDQVMSDVDLVAALVDGFIKG